jgi:peptidyl-prolyl cis-trans isomerase B (cyclophilin B)
MCGIASLVQFDLSQPRDIYNMTQTTLKWIAAGMGVVTGLAIATTFTGCGRTPAQEAAEKPAQSSAELPTQKYLSTFEQATIRHQLEGQTVPVDFTISNKSTAKIRLKVEELWSSFPLTDTEGNPLTPVVEMETALGNFQITLNPEWAANHVRNFLSLVQASYYDGLRFDRVVRQKNMMDGKEESIEFIQAGCPVGTGEVGIGHLGYFVKNEFNKNIKHEVGTVGLLRDTHPDSAGVRFYIVLADSPPMDGAFSVIGKVTKGMDVVHKISRQPMLPLALDPTGEMPSHPVIIQKAKILPTHMATPSPSIQNKP